MLVIAFLAVAVIGPFVGISQLDAASNRQNRLTAAREQLDALVRVQLSEETGLRGYMATGDRYFLAPDGPPSPEFSARSRELEELETTSGSARGAAIVREMRALHARWEREVAVPLLANPVRRDALAKQTYGKLLTDQLRSSAQLLRGDISLDIAGVQRILRSRINSTVAISALVVALFALAAVMLSIARSRALERLAREQSLVNALQQTLRVGGARLARTSIGFSYASATREALVGGDLLDSWRVGPDRGWLLIADVSGKGILAARISAFVQYALRALTFEHSDPGDVLTRFNRLFAATFDDPSVFVVVFLGTFDATTQQLRYASAGHAGAYVTGPRGFEVLPPTGALVGLGLDEPYATAERPMEAGETLVLATDGLTEARDEAGAFLGDDGVRQIVGACTNEPQVMCDALVGEVMRRSNGSVSDDLAILAVRIDAVEGQDREPFSTMRAEVRPEQRA